MRHHCAWPAKSFRVEGQKAEIRSTLQARTKSRLKCLRVSEKVLVFFDCLEYLPLEVHGNSHCALKAPYVEHHVWGPPPPPVHSRRPQRAA